MRAELYVLSLVEFFERLAFGAVLPLFALYLQEHLGHSEASAIALSSGFLAAAYLASLPGGFIADHLVGAVGALALGAILIATGFVGLAADHSGAFWPAIVALLLGQGLVKPSMSTLVGSLYHAHDPRREAGFSIFYVAINLGALSGPLVSEWARAGWGWRSIFVCAATAMLPALLLLIAARGALGRRADHAPRTLGAASNKDDRSRFHALFLISGVAVIFWLAFQQTGASLAFFAQAHTVRRVGFLRWSLPLRPGHFAALHAGLVIVFTPLELWAFGRLRQRRAEPSAALKMIWGFLFTAAAFAIVAGASLCGGDTGRVSPLWLLSFYAFLSLGELLLSPMGLSLVTELAPPRFSGCFTGLWFVAIAIGHGLAAALGPFWRDWPHHRYFALMALLLLGAAGVILVRLQVLELLLSRTKHADEPRQTASG